MNDMDTIFCRVNVTFIRRGHYHASPKECFENTTKRRVIEELKLDNPNYYDSYSFETFDYPA